MVGGAQSSRNKTLLPGLSIMVVEIPENAITRDDL